MTEQRRSGTSPWGWLALGFVIFVLIAILKPVFAPSSRRHYHPSPGSLCLNNLKQIGMAVHMYMQDWGGCYPMVSGFGPELDKHRSLWGARGDILNRRGSDRKYMPHLIEPYIKHTKILVCPKMGENAVWIVPDGKVDFRQNGTSYVFNAWCAKTAKANPPSGCIEIAGQNESICRSPADAPIVWDGISGYAKRMGQVAQLAHEDSINVLCADTHTRNLAIKADASPWNRTLGRGGHFWAAVYQDPNGGSVTTRGAVGWWYVPPPETLPAPTGPSTLPHRRTGP